jgi:primosomal protein N' (replication factor Y)
MPKVAKVAILSPLPQLDRLFDYNIPEKLIGRIQVGSRIKVPFGKSGRQLEAFVIEVADRSSFAGELSEVTEVIDSRPALQPQIHQLARELSDRSATTLGEVLKLAIPNHRPRAMDSHNKQAEQDPNENPLAGIHSEFSDSKSPYLQSGTRHAVLCRPGAVALQGSFEEALVPSWVKLFVEIAQGNILLGKSSILLVPNYREHFVLVESLIAFGLEKHIADYSHDQPKSKLYKGFLRALDRTPRIVVGSRSAAFAPAFELGSIAIYDESDHSFTDQASPFLATRDVLLVRQNIEQCSLVFAGHARSTDIERLVGSGYLFETSEDFVLPKVSISEPGFRIDSNAYRAIKQGLLTGSVLVQVASIGESSAIFCSSCDTRSLCRACGGPIWIDSSGHKKCRWCNSFALDSVCSCGSNSFSSGRAGSTRTAAELGRSFSNVRVIESTGEKRIIEIERGINLVVATAGAEPYCKGGYQAVVLLDAKVLLARQNLRSQEDAVRLWANAIAKLSRTGEAVLVGVQGKLSQRFSLWQIREIAREELVERAELLLPPTLRLGSIAGDQALLMELSPIISSIDGVKTIGPAPFVAAGNQHSWRLIFKYSYGSALELAQVIKSNVYKLSAGKTAASKTGRNSRVLKVRMNDAEVV